MIYLKCSIKLEDSLPTTNLVRKSGGNLTILQNPGWLFPNQPMLLAEDSIDSFAELKKRLGAQKLSRRMLKQAELWAKFVHQGQGIMSLERVLPVDSILATLLKFFRLYERGNRNFRDLQVVENRVASPNLPLPFEGFRILQLTDLHLDLDTSLTIALNAKLEGLDYDLVVITGDFRNTATDYHGTAMEETEKLMQCLKPPVFGVLGNHDFIEMVPDLEKMGIRFLLNENHPERRDGEILFIVGIDDPTFYRTHDFATANSGILVDDFSILLSHGPTPYREAAEFGFDLMLCGHTHGGQVCLPRGFALVRNGDCPSSLFTGPWSHRKMHGYTSRGTGCTGIPVRFNCPPEITIHELHQA